MSCSSRCRYLSQSAITLTLVLWSCSSSTEPEPRHAFPPHAYRFDWELEDRFPELRIRQPIDAAYLGGAPERWLILERSGVVKRLRATAEGFEQTVLLDFSAEVGPVTEERGAMGLAPHPNYLEPPGAPGSGDLFVFYTAFVAGEIRDRLSRFHVPFDADPSSKPEREILIDQLDESGLHNGGGLRFGPDGFLYIGVGDEGPALDVSQNAQKIDENLFSGILRIDVDRRGGDASHPPPRQPDEGRTAGYFIPSDNPFVGKSGALEEFFSIGLRNPFRISFDIETGKLWLGDVGERDFDEINIASSGSNHQWSYREGDQSSHIGRLKGKRPDPLLGFEVPPLHSIAQPSVRAVIGGTVYRGDRYPELRGKYIYGDNATGKVFALSFDEQRVVSDELLVRTHNYFQTGIASIVPGPDGDIHVLTLGNDGDMKNGKVFRLRKREGTAPPPIPAKLSQTTLFRDVTQLVPASDVITYEIAASAKARGVEVLRWLRLPTDPDSKHSRVGFKTHDLWSFPDGTVFANHYGVSLEGGEFRKIETQVLVRDPFRFGYLLSYRWNEEGTDAVLVEKSQSSRLSVREPGGETREFDWYFASGEECLTCHRDRYRIVLGMTTAQLNRTVQTPEGAQNQLEVWNQRELFTRSPRPIKVDELPHMVPVGDPNADVEMRVASLFTANCAHCHAMNRNEPGKFMVGPPRQPPSSLLLGKRAHRSLGGEAKWLLDPGHPEQSAVYIRASSKQPGVQMPPVAQYALAEDELALLASWIEELGRDSFSWRVTYYSRQDLSGRSQVTQARSADFHLHAGLRLFPKFPMEGYSLLAQTCLHIPRPTSLTVELTSPNQVQMLIDGEPVFQEPRAENFGRQQTVLAFAKGEHEVAIELKHHRGPGSLRLRSVLAGESFSGFPTALQCDR